MARMFIDTVIDPLPGELGMPVAQLLLLSLGACFLPALVFLETPSDATLDLARRAIEVVGRDRTAADPVPRSAGRVRGQDPAPARDIRAEPDLRGPPRRVRVHRGAVRARRVVGQGEVRALARSSSRACWSWSPRRPAARFSPHCSSRWSIRSRAAGRGASRLGVLLLRLGLLAGAVAGVVWLVGYLEEERLHQPDRAVHRHAGGRGRAGAHRHGVRSVDAVHRAPGARQPLRRAAFLHLSAQHHRRVADGDRHRRGGAAARQPRGRDSRGAARHLSSPSLAWIGLIYLQYLVNGMVSGSLYFDTTFWAYGFASMVVAQGLGRPPLPSRA